MDHPKPQKESIASIAPPFHYYVEGNNILTTNRTTSVFVDLKNTTHPKGNSRDFTAECLVRCSDASVLQSRTGTGRTYNSSKLQ